MTYSWENLHADIESDPSLRNIAILNVMYVCIVYFYNDP